MEAGVDFGVEVVDFVVAFVGFAGEVFVPFDEGAGGVVEHAPGDVGHAPEFGFGGGDRVVAEEDGDPGDALGVVGDSFEFDGDGADRHEFAQVAGDGLLEGDDVEHCAFDVVAQLVDLGIGGGDAAGEDEVAAQQGLHGVDDGAVGAGVEQAQAVDDFPGVRRCR